MNSFNNSVVFWHKMILSTDRGDSSAAVWHLVIFFSIDININFNYYICSVLVTLEVMFHKNTLQNIFLHFFFYHTFFYEIKIFL